VAGAADVQTAVAESGSEWPRYPRILVALDDTPAAAFAMRHVVPYALEQRSQLTLLTVVPAPSRMVVAAGVSPQRMAEEMERQAELHLRQVTATLPHELSVTTILRHGDPAEEILALVRAHPVDLICMGARGRGRVSGALLGSVSSAVLHHSPVPVLVLHPPHEPG
jgi:nucleotide-binding universal stress UspA family protein